MRTRRVPLPIRLLFAADLALGLLYLASAFTLDPESPFAAFLDLDHENNLPSWYSSTQWIGAALLVGVFAARQIRPAQRRSWALAALPLVFLALSLDEAASIHERLGTLFDRLLPGGTRAGGLFHRTGIWMFVLGIPFALGMACLGRAVHPYFQRAPRAFTRMASGMILMLAGAAGLELAYNAVALGSGSMILQVLSEELCEMLGTSIVVWGAWELLRAHGFALALERVDPWERAGELEEKPDFDDRFEAEDDEAGLERD